MRYIDDHGLIADGHDLSRAEAIDQAAGWLVERGWHRFDAENALAQPTAIARAWWSDDCRDEDGNPIGAGFVQEHHDGARPVIVFHVHPMEVTQ